MKGFLRIDSTRTGFTIMELMVAVAIGMIALAIVAALTIYGLRSFTAIGNYTDLDAKSRAALDEISVELRSATAINGLEANPPIRWLSFTNTTDHTGIKITWDQTARTLVTTRYKQGSSPFVKTNLTECDWWEFSLYQQSPKAGTTNEFHVFQGGLNHCKLVNMSWRSSRTMLGKKWHTETVQTAKIVLRNAR